MLSKSVGGVLKWVRTCRGAAAPFQVLELSKNEVHMLWSKYICTVIAVKVGSTKTLPAFSREGD